MFFYETLSCVSDRQSIEDTQDTHCDGYIPLGIVSLCGWFSLCTSYGCVFPASLTKGGLLSTY